MAGVLVFMFLAFGTPKAHADEWKAADQWAITVVSFNRIVVACEKMFNLSQAEFKRNKMCNLKKFHNILETLTDDLSVESNNHPSNEKVADFAEEHFTNPAYGELAIHMLVPTTKSVTRMMSGIRRSEKRNLPPHI